ncbi:CHD1 helical C-terminal domain containing protein 1 [Rissa tridactyla]|uniref:CHD1 helical C-terminal domain containing protein 1 n=1 Tax=Rissa tridactyla TaxID=75485 RepID=UPI0023BAEB64|nr:CHD1 helical C-terminal domain containing protein 1 [Rissa tridactyla]
MRYVTRILSYFKIVDFADIPPTQKKQGATTNESHKTTKNDLAGTAKEAAFVTGSESSPPCKTPLICCAEGLDQDTFKICKELLSPFKKSLRKLHLPQHVPTERKLKYTKESLTIIGERIDLFLQQYCRASEVKHWQKRLWRFVSLFSEMDAKQLQKLYMYLKNNQMDKFLQLCCPSENPDSHPGLKEEKMQQLYIIWGLCRDTRDLQEHPGQRPSHHQHTHKVTAQQQHSHSQCHVVTKQEKPFPAQVEPPTLGISAKGSAGEDVISGGARGVEQVPRQLQRSTERQKSINTVPSPEQKAVSMVSQSHKILKYLQRHSNKLQPKQN